MVLMKLLRLLRGYLVISVTGFFAERFLNLANTRGIKMWRIRRRGSRKVSLCLRVRDFRKLREVRRATGVSIHIEKKCGLPFLLHKYRRRWGIVVGAALFIGIILFLSTFVWSIEISGNQAVEDEQIIAALDEAGFYVGVPTRGLDLREIRQTVLLKLEDLSFIAINIKGSKAYVEVTEATGKPEMVDTDTPCNLIATKAGVIVRTEITQGFGLVRAGDAVEAGDMLVSGMVFSDKVGYHLVHSSGRIYARTAYQLEYEVPYVQTERVRTGEEYTHRKLRLFNFHINLYLGAGERYTTYDKINKTNEAKLGGFTLPLALLEEKYFEVELREKEYSPEQAESMARLMLDEGEREQFADKQIEVREVEVKHENGACRIVGRYQCVEDIAAQSEVDPSSQTPAGEPEW